MTQTCEPRNGLPTEIQHCALVRLLANSLVLSHTAPYLSCYDVLNLAATSRAFHFLVYHTPHVFRRLELGNVKTAQFDIDGMDRGGETWRNVQLDENLTEDDFYSGPLRGIFSSLRRIDILKDVQVLSLDGLCVTAELVHDILIDPSFSVRILSIRGVRHLNERKLRGALQYACRESRPEGTPRLKGVYIFGPKDPTTSSPPTAAARSSSTSPCVASTWNSKSQQALNSALAEEPEAWYGRRGDQFHHRINAEWASTLIACASIIAFDSVLCAGPRHFNSPAWGTVNLEALNVAASRAAASVPPFGVATHSLGGCASCGSAPEGWTIWGEEVTTAQRDADGRRMSDSPTNDIGRFPLLAPPPMHSANLHVAMCPAGQSTRSRIPNVLRGKPHKAMFIPRCFDCIRDRYCAGCHRWWCESCYLGPGATAPAPRAGSPSGANSMGYAQTGSACSSNPKRPSALSPCSNEVQSDGFPPNNGRGPRFSFMYTPSKPWHLGVSCAADVVQKAHVSKSCWECGMNCKECIDYTQRMCQRCGGGYCLIHNEGSDLIACDWCVGRTGRIRRLYRAALGMGAI